MDAALEQVERHCGAQLSGYSSCIDAKPETWLVDCAHLKHHLTQCARTHSLLVGALKERCAPQVPFPPPVTKKWRIFRLLSQKVARLPPSHTAHSAFCHKMWRASPHRLSNTSGASRRMRMSRRRASRTCGGYGTAQISRLSNIGREEHTTSEPDKRGRLMRVIRLEHSAQLGCAAVEVLGHLRSTP